MRVEKKAQPAFNRLGWFPTDLWILFAPEASPQEKPESDCADAPQHDGGWLGNGRHVRVGSPDSQLINDSRIRFRSAPVRKEETKNAAEVSGSAVIRQRGRGSRTTKGR